jgi:type II secretory pathway pseudopilin PulG
MSLRRCRSAFTIVELLVVASIMAMLFGLILAGGRSRPGNDVSRAARQIAAVLLSAQSRAIGSRTGAAVIFQSDGDPAVATDLNKRAIRLRDAEMAPNITAEVPATLVAAAFSANMRSFTLSNVSPANASPNELQGGFKIRFLPPLSVWSPWYGYDPAKDDPSKALVFFREREGQTAETSVWPPATAAPSYAVEIARYPGIGTEALTLPRSVAIDLRYSSHGDDPVATNWGRLDSRGLISVSFDTVGRVALLMQNVTGAGGARTVQPLAPTQAIYFFVVTREDLDADLRGEPSTLSRDSTAWLVIDPQSGRVTVAANAPQSIAPNTHATREQLRAARRLARLSSFSDE